MEIFDIEIDVKSGHGWDQDGRLGLEYVFHSQGKFHK